MNNTSNIRLLLLDVDGVLTDGSIIVDETGKETKRFHVRDGLAIKAWRDCGYLVGLLTARNSRATALRAEELGIEIVEQGAADKLIVFENLCTRLGVEAGEVAYMGDDLQDLPVLRRVAMPMAPADAAEEVRQVAQLVTEKPGGRGAVREAVEHLLTAAGRWDEVIESYSG